MEARQILKLLVRDKSLIQKHLKWGYYIKVPFDEIKMIGLIDDDEGGLKLSFHFGASQAQSRAFYNGNIDLGFILESSWEIKSDFHLSNSLQNLIWFESELKIEPYMAFWKQNQGLLFQHNRSNITKFLNSLAEKNIILFNDSEKARFKESVFSKAYSRFNISPGVKLIYKLSEPEFKERSKEGTLKTFLVNKLNEALKVIGQNGDDFLINGNIDGLGFNDFTDSVDPDGL